MRAVSILMVLATSTAPASAQVTIFPEWLGRDTEAWSGRREPQIRDAAALFASAGAAEEDALEDAVLLCRVHAEEPVNGRWDVFADPDLRIVVSVGGRRSVIWGTENSRGHIFSVPGVRLRRGQRLTMAVSDRDVTSDEHIGRIDARYEGRLPIELRARYLEGECRLAPRAIVTARLATAIASAAAGLEAVERAEPALGEPDLGRPRTASIEAARRLVEAASYGGWQHGQVRPLRHRFEESERAFEGRLRRVIADAHRTAPRRGERVIIERGGAVRVQAFACGGRARQMAPLAEASAPDRCVAHLEVTSARDEVPSWLGTVDLIDARGLVHTAQETRFIERADETTVRVAVILAPRIVARGALVRAGAPRALLRLD